MTDNNSAPELLPCPFCGAKNPKVHLVEATGEVHSVECKTCFAECDDVAAWNRRADLCAANRGVTDAMVDAWRIAFHESYKGQDDYNTSIRKGLIAALQPTEAGTQIVDLGNPAGLKESRASLMARQVRQTMRDYGHKSADTVLPDLIANDVNKALEAQAIAWPSPPTPPTDNAALVEAEDRGMSKAADICRAEQLRREKQMEELSPKLGCMQRERFRVGAQQCGLLAKAIDAALASRRAPPAVTVARDE